MSRHFFLFPLTESEKFQGMERAMMPGNPPRTMDNHTIKEVLISISQLAILTTKGNIATTRLIVEKLPTLSQEERKSLLESLMEDKNRVKLLQESIESLR